MEKDHQFTPEYTAGLPPGLMNIYAVHGFLGLPEDWQKITIPKNLHFHSVNLNDSHVIKCFGDWSKVLLEQTLTKENILMGYSLGGRLALHALKASPERWRGAIFISTHPGLQSEPEREARMIQDEHWAKIFENEPWDEVMKRWNRQAVFGHDQCQRFEKDYSRATLASMLRGWSLAKQEDFRPFLASVDCPILWVTGKKDQKFDQLAKSLYFKHPQSRFRSIANASHRLLWEAPEQLQKIIINFFEKKLI